MKQAWQRPSFLFVYQPAMFYILLNTLEESITNAIKKKKIPEHFLGHPRKKQVIGYAVR